MRRKKRDYVSEHRMMGKIYKYNKEKGFGFVRCFDDGKSYFFHAREFMDDTPENGMTIEFAVVKDFDRENNEREKCVDCLVVNYPGKN